MVEHPEDRAQDALTADLAAQEHVGGDIQGGTDRQVLVHRLDARGASIDGTAEVHHLAVEQDVPSVRDHGSRQALDERRLAGAVVTDDPQDLARVELEVGMVERHHPAIGLDQSARFQDRPRLVHAETLRTH